MTQLFLVIFKFMSALVGATFANDGVFITAGNPDGTANIRFYIEDETGRRTGQTANGSFTAQIPGTRGRYSSPSTRPDGDSATDEHTTQFHATGFPAGQFKIVLASTFTTPFFLQITLRNTNLSRSQNDYSGFLLAQAPTEFRFAHQPSDVAPLAPIKTVTLASLRQSLQAALVTGQLGDSAFVSRLDKMLIKAEEQVGKGQKKQAADRLDQFIHRLDSAFKKEPDPNADDDPSDKKSADNFKRFILEQAQDSLRSDARTLIVSLGETPKR